MESEKPIHSLILDTGPIIRNEPSVSSLLAQSEELLAVPSIISEIRDAVTRIRVETTLVPFIKLRTPSDASFRFVSDFARKTGDAAVLSRVDLQVAALAYEVECERNQGDWRLRRVPGQKRVNGSPPKPAEEAKSEGTGHPPSDVKPIDGLTNEAQSTSEAISTAETPQTSESSVDQLSQSIAQTSLEETQIQNAELKAPPSAPKADSVQATPEDSPETDPSSDSSDGGEWITPSNLKRRQAQDSSAATTTSTPVRMQVATLTTDNALQNLLLQINLNLLSPSLTRITSLRRTLLRCHACFLLHQKPDLQFCTRCGKPSLTRVTVTTSSNGETKVHLKKNMQWNNRGERYSIPKPTHGTANGRSVKGQGGKEGWGNGLVLAPDQKEFVRAEEERKRKEGRTGVGLMDEAYLPSILTGRREGREGGRVRVGAGRAVNSKKR